MKKLLILFSFAILVIFTPIADAQEINSTQSAVFKYNLAYPGLLPNSPLYSLKVLRDKLTEFMISDPEEKVKFYLLQTDKGILAASILSDKKEMELAKKTALKAENNYTLLTFELKKMKKLPNEEIMQKLKIAALKHQMILNSIIENSPEKDKGTFEQVFNFSKTNLNTVENLEKLKK